MTPPRSTGQRIAIGLALVLTVALVAGGSVSAAADLVIQSKNTTHTFTGTFTSLSVNVDGDVTVQAGPTGQITVATHQVWSFVRPAITETLHGDRLTVKVTCNGFSIGECGTSERLTVPPRVALDVDSSDSNVTVDGISGALNLHSSDGDVSVSNDSGPLQLSSDDGNVQGTDLSSSAVTASSTDGDVNLRFTTAPRSVSGTSSDGSVEVGLPRGPAPYLVSASSDNGSRSVDVHTDSTSERRISVDSNNGDVSVYYSGP
jgi:DUF4097 and DUF4098 domain-containing protein YvlB